MAPDAEYVRVLVVKQAELALYTKEMAALNSICKPLQQTMIMTLPKSLSLKQLTGLSPAYRNATAHCDPNDTLGIGYARLCIQLVARALQLQDVWMVDDNIQDCWQLDLSAQSLHQPPPGQGPTHGPLQSCSFDTIMRGIELQVSKTVVISAVSSPFTSGSLVRSWQPELSPRQSTAQTSTGSNVKTWFDYSGSHEHYAIIGPSRQPYRYKLVGATWPGGAGPPPFKITHSVYSFFLLNVAATMSAKPAVLWPARQYAEDIEFNHMCEDSKLAVVKCNRFFFHKANLQGVDLRQAAENPRVHIKPTLGPIWGGQHLDVQIQPEQHQTSVHSITVCGSRNVYCAQTPILSPELPLHMAPVASHQSNVVTGSVTVQCGTTQLEALQQYTYHGLWEWPPGTIVDNTTADKGKSSVCVA